MKGGAGLEVFAHQFAQLTGLGGAGAAGFPGDADLAALHRNMAHLRHIVQAEEATLKPLLDAVGSALVVKLDQRAQDIHDLDAIADLGRDLVAATATR